MAYHDPGCAYCPPTVRACRQGETEQRGPAFCPTKVDEQGLAAGRAEYDDPGVRRMARVAAEVESEGYCEWTRVEEICAFAHKMEYRKLGIATCISFVDHAYTLSTIFESHGFEVASAGCKLGEVAKEEIGLRDDQKIKPGGHESMCNPVTQAELLNRAGCDFNVVLGLCVGHDSLFFSHSDAPVTVLVAKDRVLAHNPIGALQFADTYYARLWGPDRPEKPPKKPVEGRRR